MTFSLFPCFSRGGVGQAITKKKSIYWGCLVDNNTWERKSGEKWGRAGSIHVGVDVVGRTAG